MLAFFYFFFFNYFFLLLWGCEDDGDREEMLLWCRDGSEVQSPRPRHLVKVRWENKR